MAKSKFASSCIALAVTTACMIGPSAARAQANDVTVEISRCVDLQDPEERRACYGAQVDAAVRQRERSAATAEPAAAAPAAAEPAAAAPASAAPHPTAEPALPGRARRDGAADQPAVVAKIAGLRETVPNSYLITLDNGQVWRQIRSKWHPLRVGQGVRIFATGWGNSFRLFGDGLSGYIQVEQVR